jgi:hypothetical protein
VHPFKHEPEPEPEPFTKESNTIHDEKNEIK